MDTKDLNILMQAVRHSSFAGAARALALDPSSVSRTVAALEEELGIRLFQRSTRRLRLTESGSVFVDRIAVVLDELEQAKQAAVDATSEIRGRLRITVPNTFGIERLVPILPKFCEDYPTLDIDLLFSESVIDVVAEGLDVAIRLAPLRDSTLVAVPILDIRYLVVVSPQWLKTLGRIPDPVDMRNIPCMCLALPGRERWLFQSKENGDTSTVHVHTKILASNATALRDLAVAGMGPVLLADWLVAREISAGRLIELFPSHEVSYENATVKAWAVYPTRNHVPAKVRVFIDFLRRTLAE